MVPSPVAQSYWKGHSGYDLREDDKSYNLSVDVPGVKAEDMTIKVEANTLRVSGFRKRTTSDGKSSEERKFDYRLTLGDDVDVDNISANLENGVLQLTAPKKKPEEPKARVIQVTNGVPTSSP